MLLGDIDLKKWLSEARADGNPYLTEWFAVMMMAERISKLFRESYELYRAASTKASNEGTDSYTMRKTLTKKYAWAVPCQEVIDVLAEHAPLVEIGAGTGYWAWLLRKRGVDILAYDASPPPSKDNGYHKTNEAWTKVERGGPEKVNGRSLFLCWPPYANPFALDCLKRHCGDTLIFVGEHYGGCTADDGFFAELEAKWQKVRDVDIPQFDGIYDYMSVWKR